LEGSASATPSDRRGGAGASGAYYPPVDVIGSDVEARRPRPPRPIPAAKPTIGDMATLGGRERARPPFAGASPPPAGSTGRAGEHHPAPCRRPLEPSLRGAPHPGGVPGPAPTGAVAAGLNARSA